MSNSAGGVLLDIGCGGGSFAHHLEGLYSHYIGTEPSDIPRSRELNADHLSTVTLVHNDPTIPLPVAAASVDIVTMIASYDHIPDLELVLPSAWSALVPGGLLLINMTNYGFWAKRVVNRISKGQRFRHADDHFRVHTPESLVKEIQEWIPDVVPDQVVADYWYLPRPPARVAHWLPVTAVRLLNRFLRLGVHGVLRQRNVGSSMIVMFRKTTN